MMSQRGADGQAKRPKRLPLTTWNFRQRSDASLSRAPRVPGRGSKIRLEARRSEGTTQLRAGIPPASSDVAT